MSVQRSRYSAQRYYKGDRITSESAFTYIFNCYGNTMTNRMNKGISPAPYCFSCHKLLSTELPCDVTRFKLCSCERLFCSPECVSTDTVHDMLCGNKLYKDFQMFCIKSNLPMYDYAGQILVEILSQVINNTELIDDQVNVLKEKLDSFQQLHSQYSIDTSVLVQVDESMEAFYLFKSMMVYACSTPVILFEKCISIETWCIVCEILRKYSVPIYLSHPAVEHILNVSQIKDMAERHRSFRPYEPYAQEVQVTLDPKAVGRATDDGSDDSDLVVERKLLRLVQAASADNDSASKPFSALAYQGVGLLPIDLAHSCMPSLAVQVEAREALISCYFVALHDINPGEELTVSFLHGTDQLQSQREQALKELFGPLYKCCCRKCEFERSAGSDVFFSLDGDLADIGIDASDLMRLAHSYMQEQQYVAVLNVIACALARGEVDGDTFHLAGAACLSLNRWSDARKLWRQGLLRFPRHERLQDEVLKDNVYTNITHEWGALAPTAPAHCSFDAYEVKGKACIFASQSPLITQEECAFVIQSAEGFAASGAGWTTSRHYAAPTTDIPIHAMAEVAAWFNQMMAGALQTHLLKHLGTSPRSRVHVHDAFVVKYQVDSGSGTSQRYLPIHADESTHSFVIALNAAAEYVGGGTYFVGLGEAVRPDTGHVVMFSGDLFHGGDPILSGVRYIIAAFLYIEDDQSTPSLADVILEPASHPQRKRHKATSSIENSQLHTRGMGDQQAASFSFGFSL